jgi:hypothetical protein
MTTGKEEQAANKILREQLKGFNGFDAPLGLTEGLASAVPDDAALVVIHGPSTAFMESEVAALRTYAKSGKSMLLLLEPNVDVGLTPLLADLGIKQQNSTVCDDKIFYPLSRSASDHAFLVTNGYSSHAAVKTLSRIREKAPVLLRSAASFINEKSDSAEVDWILRSMPKAYLDQNGNFVLDPETEKPGTLNLAAAVTISIPDKDRKGRAVIIGDSDCLADMLVGNQANLILGYELLNWLFGNDQISGEVAVEEDVPIRHTRDKDMLWFYSTTCAAPVIVLGVGLGFVHIKRRRRRLS